MKCPECGDVSDNVIRFDGGFCCSACDSFNYTVEDVGKRDVAIFTRNQAEELIRMAWIGEYPTTNGYYYVQDGDKMGIVMVNWIKREEIKMLMFFEANTLNWLEVDCGYYEKEQWGPMVIMPNVNVGGDDINEM